jgi:hypothetical protein
MFCKLQKFVMRMHIFYRSHHRSGGRQGERTGEVYQSTVTLEETREGQEIIEVQILPQVSFRKVHKRCIPLLVRISPDWY